jgi:hypothetical protein
MKKLAFLAAIAVSGLSLAEPAPAQNVSRNNPYRAFNHTGVNYGAQQLERQSYRGGYGYGSGGYGGGGIVGSAYRGVTAPIAGVTNNNWSYRSAYGWGGAPAYSGGYYRGNAGSCW